MNTRKKVIVEEIISDGTEECWLNRRVAVSKSNCYAHLMRYAGIESKYGNGLIAKVLATVM